MPEEDVREAYPFPRDEMVYCIGGGFEDPQMHSYTAVAELPDWHRMEINGAPHNNSHRLVIHTPVRGPVSFLTRPRDMEGFILCALRLAAEGEGVFGPKGEIELHESWIEHNLGGPVTWVPADADAEYTPKDEKEASDA